MKGTVEIVDLSSDDESEKVGPVVVKLEPDYVRGADKPHGTDKGVLAKFDKFRRHATGQDAEENISSNAPSTGHSNSSVLEQGPSPVDDTGISYASSICAAPLCKQFWKAGSYNDGLGSQITVQSKPICVCVF